MLSSKNVDDFVEVKFHAIVYMHQSQSTQPILTYGRSKIDFQAAKNTDTALTFTAGDRQCAHKTQYAMNVGEHCLVCKCQSMCRCVWKS